MTGEENVARTEAGQGNFGECLVGGSPEEHARRRKIKRRALIVSVSLQGFGLAVLVIAPLLAKPAELVVRHMTPIPPYSHTAAHQHATEHHLQRTDVRHETFMPTTIPTYTAHIVDRPTDDRIVAPEIPGASGAPEAETGLRIADTRPQPVQPIEPRKTTRIRETNIDPALLIHRVEPVFPPLMRQIRRSGKVELHAIIATDGTIQSLEVVSGDPLFIPSAEDAVRQWRYKPTYLNGQPVEIDTFITVVYTLKSQ